MPTEEASFDNKSVVCTTADADCDALDQQLSRSWLRVAVAAGCGAGMVLSLALNMTLPALPRRRIGCCTAAWCSPPWWWSLLWVAPCLPPRGACCSARRLSIEGLFTLSLLGAFIGSLVSSLTGEGAVFYEIVSIVIAIYTVGRMLSERSQAKLRLEISERFDAAAVQLDGAWVVVPVSVTPGSRVWCV